MKNERRAVWVQTEKYPKPQYLVMAESHSMSPTYIIAVCKDEHVAEWIRDKWKEDGLW